MNILYLDWPCYGREHALKSMKRDFHFEVDLFSHDNYSDRFSDVFDKAFDAALEKKNYDLVFSFNFYPLVAEGCKRHNIKYAALVYDSPQVKLYSYRISYPTNYVFLFDSTEYRRLHDGGLSTVYYAVLPASGDAINDCLTKPYDRNRVQAEVSFVGSLYDEEHNFYDRVYDRLPEFTKGYLDACIQAQKLVQGYNFLEEVLYPDILDALQAVEPYAPYPDGVETLPYVYASYYLGRKLASIERAENLQKIAARHPVKLFTQDISRKIEGVQNLGPCDYIKELPLIFHFSRINLNFTYRSIQSGIPLRCMEILGAGGFLLSNYQADLCEYFVPGEDFVYFEDTDDLVAKVDYYLAHEDERKAIAQRGSEKALREHSYKKCLGEIFEKVL